MTLSKKAAGTLAALSVPVRIYLGLVFVLASLYKIAEPYDFALSVATYQIAPLYLINIFSIILPWLELVVGIFFIVGFWTKENAFLILGMMILFIITLSIALSSGHEMTCGCFASQEAVDDIGFHTLFRDIFWVLLALFTLVFDNGRFGVDGLLRRRTNHA